MAFPLSSWRVKYSLVLALAALAVWLGETGFDLCVYNGG